MEKFVIIGGQKLSGTVEISGAKNSVLALMPATILASGTYKIYNTPDLRDVKTMSQVLMEMGVDVKFENHVLTINTENISKFEAPYELVKKMRASIYVLGPLVGRFGYARVSLPGGCAWGPRPVDLHIEGIRKLGAEVELDAGYIVAKAKQLKGAKIHFDKPSVGATGNIMMASVLAKGTTVIENAAKEPEIVQLGEFLISMGARINGLGTDKIEIEGVDALHPADIVTIPDRIEAGTFLVAGAITGGRIKVEKCNPSHFEALLLKLEDAGCHLNIGADFVEIEAPDEIKPVDVTTAVYPGFPTDMQAQWIALMSIANGTSVITETIFYDRFKHVPELVRLGADIEVNENVAIVRGVKKLKGTKVMSTDLRASASLILAGLVAEGRTEVLRIYHIDRGYEHIEKKLQQLGAQIWREKTDEF
ncbi:UDP-N-acetylglucosamine 1-carboxyvinyltransferase [Candidatus Kryptonium thompsonii]|uniref:UDP-N-acetylglucosamine 1-carboxyvinyltransferase n=1 Tax=Candidatus Kryptonium thompsonii TaxID=1633631 RepID=A0A0P1MJ39_9BACT|nr:UDP-N-acetylglucosamine 1-carboxyvinyltransferase [Candidatus Kryptonium thompsoni]CUS79286.1 UDP-N-acetylglucosamine 1-carboxyvinyltransferase [Candidatus Kryptonium thompsoni]CUS81476.1 UDP-N-acetylglucosamine 1-carboxyvinyltransferase [Candidatus Kryptonium thompsoni]CUS86637.1 UDP-N-acetylglucosamine 1-carboxyvinyltransferase [Candidatus Kryptonium thompsoni]CUS90204.1 UDP-N-acetylglucosamine 1-carboxyvinyltransferase [Candidatus Kryptonium thompsoni]CUS90465.1 UDP-N-acetylglucosamine 1